MKERFHLVLLAGLAALSCNSAAASEGCLSRGAAFARWDAREVRVGNGKFSASFEMRGGVLKTVSFAAGGVERLRTPETRVSAKPDGGASQHDAIEVSEAESGWSAAGERELAITVASGGRAATVRVWPGASGPVVEQSPARPLPARPGEREWGSKVFSFAWGRFAGLDACGDALAFAAPHLNVRAFTPMDRTDLCSELLDVRELEMPTCESLAYIRCGVLDVRDALTGAGVVFMRLAPMPASRTNPDAVDFAVNPSSRSVMAMPTGYPLAMLAYGGGEVGRIRALRDFQRSLWPCREGRDGVLLSNTWGDGNRDSRINEEFLQKEIEAGADIGVEVIQIDDGWQKGRSANSSDGKGKGVWNGYWAADPEFWTPDPVRFPNGLAPLAKSAAEKGLSLGLWFGPDSSEDAKNWERDADCLLGFYRELNVRHFKIDSLKLHAPEAFRRNRRFFEKMILGSDREMCFDLDCTAEVRAGFLGGMPVGQLFVENRYACRRGDKRVYYPHQTLRSLWSLAHVLDPVRLRMEFLNPAKRDSEYGGDPLRPAAWPQDALFAMTMLASPLAWMELSDVPEAVRAKWRPLVAKWKRERAALHDCVVVPVGGKPDGAAWTGFVSVGKTGGYALLFREMNAKARWRIDLADYFADAPALSAQVLSGGGKAVAEGGILNVEIPEKLGYVWISLSETSQED